MKCFYSYKILFNKLTVDEACLGKSEFSTPIDLPTPNNVPVSFSPSLFNKCIRQFVEINKPAAQSLFSMDQRPPIPILLRAETIDTTLPVDVAREQMSAVLRNFLTSVDLNILTQPYRER
jgi:hypothetical protein